MDECNIQFVSLLHEEVLKNIDRIIPEKFEHVVSTKSKVYLPADTFEEIVLQFLKDDILEVMGSSEYLKNYYDTQMKALNKKKSNWVKSAKKSVTQAAGNVTLLAASAGFMDAVESWYKDSQSYLCEYPGFENLTARRMWLAYVNDLMCAMLKVLRGAKYTKPQIVDVAEKVVRNNLGLSSVDVNDDTKTRSALLYEMPVGSEKAYKLDLKTFEVNNSESPSIFANGDESLTRYSDYNYTKDRRIRTLVRNLDLYSEVSEEQRESLILKEFKTLDETDLDLLSYIYEKISVVEFIQQGYLQLKLSIPDILRFLGYVSDSSKNYHQIRSRLAKISSYRFQDIAHINGKDEIVRVFGTFDLSYEKLETSTPGDVKYNLNAPIVSLSKDLLQAYMESKTIRISKTQVNGLGLPLAKILFYPLHQSRLDVYISNASRGRFEEELIFNANYTYFASKVRLSAKSLSGKMKSVAAALDELILNNMLIDSYELLPKHTIRIKFKPLDRDEQRNICTELNLII